MVTKGAMERTRLAVPSAEDHTCKKEEIAFFKFGDDDLMF